MKTPHVSGKSFQSASEVSKNKRVSRAVGGSRTRWGELDPYSPILPLSSARPAACPFGWGPWCPHLGHGCNHTRLQAVVRRKGNRWHMVGAL